MKQESFRDFHLAPLDVAYHNEDSFREQMGVLYLAGLSETHVVLMRSFLVVGEPGAVSLDLDCPGQDTPKAWEEIDLMIEHQGVVGTFHSHPPGVLKFSSQDLRTQNGLARSEGARWLWHGVKACDGAGLIVGGSYFVCCQMLEDRVFRFNYGFIEDDLSNPVIVLPLPPKISYKDSSYDLSALAFVANTASGVEVSC